MASTQDITIRAQAEAPSCCGKPMSVKSIGDSFGHVEYQCSNCLVEDRGRNLEKISREINLGILKPLEQQGSSTVQPSAPANATSANHDREHNAAVMRGLLLDLGNTLARSNEPLNSLNRRNGVIVGQVADAGEFAVSTEQTDKSKQALDETSALTTAMDAHLGGMSSAVAEAEEAINAAVTGLRPVEEAADDLRQAGAGPKSVAPARDGA